MKANKYEIKMTSKFRKDLKAIKKRNFDIALLNEVVLMLANYEKDNNILILTLTRTGSHSDLFE